jgi:hypothetical protein
LIKSVVKILDTGILLGVQRFSHIHLYWLEGSFPQKGNPRIAPSEYEKGIVKD